MGQSHASGDSWEGYDAQLLKDKEVQTIVVEDPNRTKNEDGIYTSSNIIRNEINKGQGPGFPGFPDDPNYKSDGKESEEEKSTVDEVGGFEWFALKTKGKLRTGWEVWQSVATQEANKTKPCFGTRMFITEEKKGMYHLHYIYDTSVLAYFVVFYFFLVDLSRVVGFLVFFVLGFCCFVRLVWLVLACFVI